VSPSNIAGGVLFSREEDAPFVRGERHVAKRPFHNAHGLLHLLHTSKVTIHVVSMDSDRHVERQPIVDGVRAVLAHIVVCTRGAKKRAGDPARDSVFGGDEARSAHTVRENVIAREKAIRLGEQFAGLLERLIM